MSSFLGVGDAIRAKGLFCCLYADRGSHYWHTPEAGGKVDKANPTQFGRALNQLGIELIAERRKARETLSFADAVDRYLTVKLDEFRSDKHRKQWRATLDT